MATVNIFNNGGLSSSVTFSDNAVAALGSLTYAQRMGVFFTALRDFDSAATRDFQSGGSISSYISGSTTVVNLDRYTVEMTGTISALGSRLSSYSITDALTGENVTFIGDLQYNNYPMYPGSYLLPGSVITGFIVTSAAGLAWANGNVVMQDDYATLSGRLSSITSATRVSTNSSGTSTFYGQQNDNSISFTYNLSTGASSFSGEVTRESIGVATTSLEQLRTSGTFTPTDYITISDVSIGVNSPFWTDIYADSDNVIMSGSVGSNFAASSGNDTITGSVFADTIDGGSGVDTVIFKGNSTGFSFTYGGASDTFAFVSSVDGNDTITGVEFFQFADKTLSSQQILDSVKPTYRLYTAYSSVKEGEQVNFTLTTTGLAAGTAVAYTISGVQANDLTSQNLSGVAVIREDGKSDISIGIASDSRVEGTEYLTLTVNGFSAQVAVLDDTKTKVGSVIFKNAEVGLYLASTGEYVLASSNFSSNDNLSEYTALKSKPSKNYIVSGVDALVSYDNGNFGLLITKVSGGKKSFSEQLFNVNGLAVGKAKKLTYAQILDKESVAQIDIDGDGRVGNVIAKVFDENMFEGSGGVYQTLLGTVVLGGSDLQVNDLPEASVILMRSKGKNWVMPKGAEFAGATYTDGGSVELLTLSKGKYFAHKFNPETGMPVGKAVVLKNDQIESREFYYDFDFNSDGVISIVGQTSVPVGWVV